jgi:hypothetical protein
MNAAGFAAMDQILDQLRAIGGLAESGAPMVAEKIRELCIENVRAQRNPYGDAWTPARDGRRMFVGIAGAITARAIGTVAMIRLSGVEVMHHIGNARGYHGGSARLGGFRRNMIPISGLPRSFRHGIKDVLEERFQHLVKRGGRYVPR